LEEKPSVISLHGRTLQQGYKGSADWDAIACAVEIAAGSKTSILGNGDVQDLAEVYKRVRETQVAGVLLGRAAQGNPWIFTGKRALKSAVLGYDAGSLDATPVGLAERFRVIIEHSEYYERLSMNRNFVAMRKHLTWYCKNFRGAAELRSRMIRVTSASEVAQGLARFSARSPEESWRGAIVSEDHDAGFANPSLGAVHSWV
jgi:tRNA-dihydrouridine synthase